MVNNPAREATKPNRGGIGLNKGVQGRNSDLFFYTFSKRKKETMTTVSILLIAGCFILGFRDAMKQIMTSIF